MYSFQSRVRYSECDEKAQLSLVGIMNYLQDCSTFQSEEVGLGIMDLHERGLGWILATWNIQIERRPRFGETITIGTWCYQMKGLNTYRSFFIDDEQGNRVVKADSQWFLYDMGANKVIRPPEDQLVYLSGEERLDMPKMERKIKLEGEGRTTSPIVVCEQHLDTNKHVNNAQYVLFALDAVNELGEEADTSRLWVQYRSMARLKDTVAPAVYACEGGHVVELASEDGTYAIVKMQGKES